MSDILKPRTVPKSHFMLWVKSGISLSGRGLFRNTLLIVLALAPQMYLSANSSSGHVGSISLGSIYDLISTPVLVCLFVLSAKLSHENRRFSFSDIPALKQCALLTGFIYISVSFIFVFVGFVVHSLWPLNSPDIAPVVTDFKELPQMAGINLISNLWFYGLMELILWFLPPVVLFTGMVSTSSVVKLAISGSMKNMFLGSFILLFVLFCLFISWSFGYLSFPVYPIFGGIIYSSFLDVYLGEGISAPVKKKVLTRSVNSVAA